MEGFLVAILGVIIALAINRDVGIVLIVVGVIIMLLPTIQGLLNKK